MAPPTAPSGPNGSENRPNLELARAAPRSNVSAVRRTLGFLIGFPWTLVPLATMRSLAALRGDARAKENARALWKLMFSGADFFCCVVWYLRGFYSMSDPYKNAKDFPLSSDDFKIVPKTFEVDEQLSFQYGANDFDMPERRMSGVYRALYFMMRHAPPPRAVQIDFESITDFQQMLKDTFKRTFVALRPITLAPSDPQTAVKYFTHDYGAPYLEKKDGRLVADLSHWENLELKCGGKTYERYGGKFSFNPDGSDPEITYLGKTYHPSDADWPRVQYIVLSTTLLAVVVELHTTHVHMLNSALFTLKTRSILNKDHPIYRLMRPFTIKSVAINEHAIHSILGDSGILLHGSALTYGSLKRLYRSANDGYKHIPLPQLLTSRGLASEAANVPYVEEGLRVWKIISDFVTHYVELYYPDDAALRADTELAAWYEGIRGGMPATSGVSPTLSRQALIDLIAVYIWNVTVYHDVTSQTGNTLYDYRLGATIVKRADKFGTWYPNFQEHAITLLAHQLTTIESVKLTDNFHCWWLDDRAHRTALKFQEELWDFHFDLAERNKKRDLTYNAMDPIYIETSVQT
jgi:hypothetical protein